MIDIQQQGTVGVALLDHGKVNALDVELLDALVDTLHELEGSDSSAVVLTGAGRAFSAGVDLFRIVDGGPDYVNRLIPALARAFEALFRFPRPTVAAVNGPAIAGGCILACACDRRLMSDNDAPIGASELQVGVPFPAAALEILRYACGDRAEEAMLTARLYTGVDAIAIGMVHERVPGDALIARAVAVAEDLGRLAPDAYRLAKAQLRKPALARIADAASLDVEVQRIWASDETRAKIQAHLDRTVRAR